MTIPEANGVSAGSTEGRYCRLRRTQRSRTYLYPADNCWGHTAAAYAVAGRAMRRARVEKRICWQGGLVERKGVRVRVASTLLFYRKF
jgi:hypothetical protein